MIVRGFIGIEQKNIKFRSIPDVRAVFWQKATSKEPSPAHSRSHARVCSNLSANLTRFMRPIRFI